MLATMVKIYYPVRTTIFIMTIIVCVNAQSRTLTGSDSVHSQIFGGSSEYGSRISGTIAERYDGFNPFHRGIKDLVIQAESPFRMSTTDALWVGAGLATTAALFISDQATYNTIKEEQFDTRWIEKVSPVITNFGSFYGVGVVGACAAYGFAAGDSRAQETAYLAAEAFVTSGMWGIVIKTLTGRQRPSTTSEHAGEWSGPFGYFQRSTGQSISSFDSFPSGHTLTAFSIATVFAEQYSDHPVVPVVCYTAASLVALSRITQNAHWLSDVFVGGVLGHLIAEEVVLNNPSKETRKIDSGTVAAFHISLTALNNQPAVTINLQF